MDMINTIDEITYELMIKIMSSGMTNINCINNSIYLITKKQNKFEIYCNKFSFSICYK